MSDYNNKDLIHIKNGDFECLKFRILEKYSDKITHMITLRHGGVSNGVYSSLNIRTVGKDNIKNVYKNLDIMCENMKIKRDDVYKAKQNHTANILILDNDNKKEYNFNNLSEECYDGYITNKSNINTLVTTADCNPIIIYDPVNNIFANVHSGWKGTLKRISKKAAVIMHDKFNSKFEDMIVCIGPSIRKCCFTSLEDEFKDKFVEVFHNEDEYITKDKDGKYHFDLIYVIKNDLEKLGIKEENIKVANICTCCNEEDFYSFRKATMRNDDDYATFATIVGLI